MKTFKVRKCIDCGCDISNLHPNTRRCKSCWAKKTGSFEEMSKYVAGFMDGKVEGIDYVVCEICGHKAQNLQSHILNEHKITPQEYKDKYKKEVMCQKEFETRSNKVKGKNNPGYQHGGKLSPWSKKNTKFTNEEIEACKKKTVESIRKSDNINTKLSYWLKKTDGDLEQAKKLLSERQSTFSLDKCVDNLGIEEGAKRWKERQEKWMTTLSNKTDEEKEQICLKKINSKTSCSNEEKELFDTLSQIYPKLIYQKVLIKDSANYVYDFCLNNKIIEFNGNYWHANPEIYAENEYVRTINRGLGKVYELTAKDIWQHDKDKIDFAKSQGYEVMVVWENEFVSDKDAVIEKCKEFLKN